jgi:hypothetical protein
MAWYEIAAIALAAAAVATFITWVIMKRKRT